MLTAFQHKNAPSFPELVDDETSIDFQIILGAYDLLHLNLVVRCNHDDRDDAQNYYQLGEEYCECDDAAHHMRFYRFRPAGMS